MTKSEDGVRIQYEVVESNTTKTEEVDEEESVSGSTRLIKYSGTVKLLHVNVDYGTIFKKHARKIKGELRKILAERPLLQTEKEYSKLVEKAAS